MVLQNGSEGAAQECAPKSGLFGRHTTSLRGNAPPSGVRFSSLPFYRVGARIQPCHVCLPQAQGTVSVGTFLTSCCLHTGHGFVITCVIVSSSLSDPCLSAASVFPKEDYLPRRRCQELPFVLLNKALGDGNSFRPPVFFPWFIGEFRSEANPIFRNNLRYSLGARFRSSQAKPTQHTITNQPCITRISPGWVATKRSSQSEPVASGGCVPRSWDSPLRHLPQMGTFLMLIVTYFLMANRCRSALVFERPNRVASR